MRRGSEQVTARSNASTGTLDFIDRKMIDKMAAYGSNVKTFFGFVPKRKIVKYLFLLVT